MQSTTRAQAKTGKQRPMQGDNLVQDPMMKSRMLRGIKQRAEVGLKEFIDDEHN